MNGKLALETYISNAVISSLNTICKNENMELPSGFCVETEEPKDNKFGDISTNVAMKLSKVFSKNPRELAMQLIDELNVDSDYISKTEIAGPGFINFYISDRWLYSQLEKILIEKEAYGNIVLDAPKSINVEYVSANPTGPLHIGNARGGAIGDVIANIYKKAGWKVTKEFYLNDAGNQIVKFGQSLYARYMQINDADYPMPENAYMGEDIKEAASDFYEIEPNIPRCEEGINDALTEFALKKNIANLHKVLDSYGIEYDVWFKESSLYTTKAVDRAIALLKSKNAVYEKEGAIWFKASEYGCEKDEVLVRSNGIPTYYASDIAYHLNKLSEREFDKAVNVWGADHHGHVLRLKMALKAAGISPDRLDIVLMQLVHLIRNDETVRISKRRGDMVTLDELLSEVDRDAVRYIFNCTTPSSHLDFDLDLAVKQSNENPVFYVQYAHARICSILRNVKRGEGKADYNLLSEKTEIALLKRMSDLSKEISVAAEEYDPSKITKYAYDIASLFHSFYNVCRVKNDDTKLMNARLDLTNACGYILRSVLGILGVSAPEEM